MPALRVLSCLSYIAMAEAMLLAVAVRRADFASAGQVMEGWNEWSHASWHQAISTWRWTDDACADSSSSLYDDSTLIQEQNNRFYGKYTSLRSKLDYSYHSNYSMERQALQDDIIDSILNNTLTRTTNDDTFTNNNMCSTRPRRPWIVFTAGAMGAGKSWTVQQLHLQGHFPLESFVTVDPDEIRHYLPEFSTLSQKYPHLAGEWTNKEAGFVAELLTLVALHQGRNVLVDGSLRNAVWYQVYIQELRTSFRLLRIAILHVTAPRHLVLQRAHERGQSTSRVVPHSVLEHALKHVPKSIQLLKHHVDYFCEIENANGLKLASGAAKTWHDFSKAWSLEEEEECQQ